MRKWIVPIMGISILANVILGFMYLGQQMMVTHAQEQRKLTEKQMAHLKNEVQDRKNSLATLQQEKALYEVEHSPKLKNFVAYIFKKIFNYNNKNYATRFDQVHDQLAGSVLSKLRATGEMGTPQIEFKNEIKSLSIYLNAVGKDQAKTLVNMETQYTVGGSDFPRKNQIYEATLQKDKNQWIVDKLELMGAFEAFDQP